MPHNRFLYPVHDLLGIPESTPIQLPDRGPLNAPQLMGMIQQIEPAKLAVIGAVVAVQLAGPVYSENIENVIRELPADLAEDAEVTITDRIGETAQGVLAGRLPNFGEDVAELQRSIELIEKVYEENWDSMPGAAAAYMVAKAAHHLSAATTIAMMPPGQIPNHGHAIMMEITHAVMFAAQSKSRSQPMPAERGQLDLLTMAQPADEIIQFLQSWWKTFVSSVTTNGRSSTHEEDRYSPLLDKLRTHRPLNYKRPKVGPDPMQIIAEVLQHVDARYRAWNLDIHTVLQQDNALEVQLLAGTEPEHGITITGGHVRVDWSPPNGIPEERKLTFGLEFLYVSNTGREHFLKAECASEPMPDPVFVTVSTMASARSMADMIAWGLKKSPDS